MNNVPQALQQLAQPTQGTTPSSKLGGLWKTVSPHLSPLSNMVSMANNHVSMTNSGVSMTNTLSSMLKGFAPAAAQAVQTAAQNGVQAMSSLGSQLGSSLGSSGLGGGVAANLGRAASVGSLSVPQAWAAANPESNPRPASQQKTHLLQRLTQVRQRGARRAAAERGGSSSFIWSSPRVDVPPRLRRGRRPCVGRHIPSAITST